ncbi:MAG: hypothetical protein EHM85_11175 [Desulfobacteraceae bacterium]|nr:MAG: hypothetical protein EHM85_11175 [Desulfobacteraceae bacterium]
MTNKNNEYNPALKQAPVLLSMRKEILSLSPEKALNRIFEAKHPAALIHSFPETDFYFLINDIGISDAFEILALASEKQWEYILDIELWEKDRIDMNSVSMWLDILFQAAPARFVKWAIEKQTEFIEYYLYKNIKVAVREHDEDPSALGKDLVTIDDIFYIRITDDYYEPDEYDAETEGGAFRDKREEFIKKMLASIAEYDYGIYRNMLFETMTVLPAEMEEEFYRLRNVRLEEKGFLSFYEAAGVYAPLKPEKLAGRKKMAKRRDENASLMPVPLYPFGMLKEDNLFAISLKKIEPGDTLNNLQAEFAALCNRIISADQKTIKSRDELTEIVKKACGYLSIGLGRMTAEGKKPDINHTAALIEKFHLENIFRTGFGLAVELKEQAEKWLKRSWFREQGFPLLFWGEEWMGFLGGLLIKKPLYFDNYKTGHLYRDFLSLSDMTESSKILEEIIALDDLFSLIGSDTRRVKDRSLNFKKLLLTLFAGNSLGLSKDAVPLPYDDFVRFFATLWTGRGKSRRINLAVKESFLSWLTERTGLKASEITEKLGRVLDNLFAEIESELKKVSQHDLDPRYINLFLIERRK